MGCASARAEIQQRAPHEQIYGIKLIYPSANDCEIEAINPISCVIASTCHIGVSYLFTLSMQRTIKLLRVSIMPLGFHLSNPMRTGSLANRRRSADAVSLHEKCSRLTDQNKGTPLSESEYRISPTCADNAFQTLKGSNVYAAAHPARRSTLWRCSSLRPTDSGALTPFRRRRLPKASRNCPHIQHDKFVVAPSAPSPADDAGIPSALANTHSGSRRRYSPLDIGYGLADVSNSRAPTSVLSLIWFYLTATVLTRGEIINNISSLRVAARLSDGRYRRRR